MTVEEGREPVVAVVVAAGSGVRLGGEVPKALRELAGRPLVAWSVDALHSGGVDEVVVVIAADTHDAFAQALAGAAVPVRFTTGGPTRQQSVERGLAAIPDDASIVLVHDAARPLVPPRVVASVIDAVRGGAVAVVPVVSVTDTVRQVGDRDSHLVDRSTLRAVQTPQGFDRRTLVTAHAAAHGREYTDDATVCEAAGHPVAFVDGSRESLKVTEPVDLAFAEAVLAARGRP